MFTVEGAAVASRWRIAGNLGEIAVVDYIKDFAFIHGSVTLSTQFSFKHFFPLDLLCCHFYSIKTVGHNCDFSTLHAILLPFSR